MRRRAKVGPLVSDNRVNGEHVPKICAAEPSEFHASEIEAFVALVAKGGEVAAQGLKGRVRKWLAHWDEVLAYCEAAANAGGGGAVMILLRGK